MLLESVTNSVFYTVGPVVNHAGHAVRSVARTARSAVSFVGSTSAYLMGDAFKSISDNVHIDTDYLDQTVEQTLRDTDIEQLQLEYLQGQVNAVVNDITDAGDAIVVDGLDAKAVAQNTDLNEAEVDQAVDNIIDAYDEAAKKTEEVLNTASQRVEELTAQGQELIL